MCAKLVIESGQSSKAGIKHRNEDACGIRIPDDLLLTTKGIAIGIADGVSGSEAGMEASQASIDGFLTDYYSTPESWTVKTSVHKVLSALNHWLHGNSQRRYHTASGMVTTFSALVLKSNTGYLFHVGDTRIYLLRDGLLECLTTDHKVVISESKEFLSRAMGMDLMMDIDYREINLKRGDVFILVSDGVYEFIRNQEFIEAIKQCDTLDMAAEQIVDLALANKSHDNVTCQVVRIKQLPKENEDEFYKRLTELPFPPVLEPGQILDGYKVLRHLHSTNRTEVYLVEDTHSNQTLILKAPSINFEDDPLYINQFLHEEWVGRRISNSHVLKVVTSRRERQCLYYVTEYVEGISLRQWMTDNPEPDLQIVRTIVEQIMLGLRAFHRLEMIHQDLKPENILIDKHGTVKIIDFGSTKIAGIEEISTPLESRGVLGTVNYSAPEYHLDQRGTALSDLFSLGVITYELLCGKLPYAREMTARNIYRLQYKSIREVRQDLPYWLDKTLAKAVQINPQNRYADISEFVYALSHPDTDPGSEDFIPFLERNPVKVWRFIALALFISNCILLYLLFK